VFTNSTLFLRQHDCSSFITEADAKSQFLSGPYPDERSLYRPIYKIVKVTWSYLKV